MPPRCASSKVILRSIIAPQPVTYCLFQNWRDCKTPLGFGNRDLLCPMVRRVPQRPWALESNAVGVFVRHAQSKRKGVGGRNAAWTMPGTVGILQTVPLSSSLPRCSSTWYDSRNQPRAGEFEHHCVACQRRMLIRSRAMTGHRSTLTSCVEALFDTGTFLVTAMALR